METTKQTKFKVVPWLKPSETAEVTFAIIKSVRHHGDIMEPITQSNDREALVRMVNYLNHREQPTERTIQFDEDTWHMLDKIVEGAKTAFDAHPLTAFVMGMGKGRPEIEKMIQAAKNEVQTKTNTPQGFLSAFIKDQYIEGIRKGLVKP